VNADLHDLRCPELGPGEPHPDRCLCRDEQGFSLREFVAGTNAMVDLIESYGPKRQAS